MAVTQSRSQVNAKASAAEPMQKPKPSSWVPDQSIEDIGGPTQYDYEPTGDSAKIENKGTSSIGTGNEVTNHGKEAGEVGGGTGGKTLKGGATTLPGGSSSASYNGTDSGRKNKGEGKLPASVAYEAIDNTAADSMDELSDDNGASDDFKMKAKVIFESALNQKLQIEVQRLEEEFASRFEEEISDIAEKVEAFLNYTSAQWLEENKLVVENGIRNELSESFVQGLRSLFEDHYVTLPDEKYDIFESMVAKLDDMEDKLNEQIETNVALNQKMSGFQRSAVVADVSWDLSEAAKDKLAGLAESVEFESEDNYRQKLNILKESFVEEATASNSGEYLEESADALAPSPVEDMTNSMAAYAAAITRTIK